MRDTWEPCVYLFHYLRWKSLNSLTHSHTHTHTKSWSLKMLHMCTPMLENRSCHARIYTLRRLQMRSADMSSILSSVLSPPSSPLHPLLCPPSSPSHRRDGGRSDCPQRDDAGLRLLLQLPLRYHSNGEAGRPEARLYHVWGPQDVGAWLRGPSPPPPTPARAHRHTLPGSDVPQHPHCPPVPEVLCSYRDVHAKDVWPSALGAPCADGPQEIFRLKLERARVKGERSLTI